MGNYKFQRTYEFEDGVKVDSSLFWMDRQDSYWNDGWSLV